MVPSPSRTRREAPRQEDPPGHPLHRATVEEEALRAAERGRHCATHRRFRVFRIHTHHTIPGGPQIEIATETSTATDETDGPPLPDARQ